ncbi:hypothetical protein DCS_01978 [Drechmeria coniospora]|uniref:Uncharacterized protein n=1 Tax=Drechmeria coniospora TaxID=98403 RepID=A0A151GUT8_DRECN|nr:hypothetical protein DCS_01978 [Drechmeria coniospora]KYK60840.1 hypothetical protein DCS_01978 [Drechmeria coniospora]
MNVKSRKAGTGLRQIDFGSEWISLAANCHHPGHHPATEKGHAGERIIEELTAGTAGPAGNGNAKRQRTQGKQANGSMDGRTGAHGTVEDRKSKGRVDIEASTATAGVGRRGGVSETTIAGQVTDGVHGCVSSSVTGRRTEDGMMHEVVAITSRPHGTPSPFDDAGAGRARKRRLAMTSPQHDHDDGEGGQGRGFAPAALRAKPSRGPYQIAADSSARKAMLWTRRGMPQRREIDGTEPRPLERSQGCPRAEGQHPAQTHQ